MGKFYLLATVSSAITTVIAFILALIFYAANHATACFIAQIVAALSSAGALIFAFLCIFHGYNGEGSDLSGFA